MSTAKLTMITLEKWMLQNEDSLFSEMVLPENIDKDVLTDNFLLRGGEFEVMYPDPYFMKDAITLWSKKWNRTFTKWVEALAIEYSPLENYDRKEDWTDTENKGTKTSGRRDNGNTKTFNNQDKRTLDTQDEETLDTENKRTLDTTIVTEEEVSAFDSSNYQPSKKDTTDNDGTDTMNNTGTDTFTHTGTDTVDYSGTIKDEFGESYSGQATDNGKTVHDGRIHGNIGVTTSQQMLEAELQIAEWNLYEHITDLFLSEFVIPIYS